MNFLSRSAAALLLSMLYTTAFAEPNATVRLCQDSACQLPMASEPYQWMSNDGKVLKGGVTDKAGNAQVVRAAGVSSYVFETTHRRWDYEVDARCWDSTFQRCIKLVGVRSIDGFDDAASVQKRAAKKAAEDDDAKAEEREALRLYAETAQSNNDDLAWLGPLPKAWPADDVRARWKRTTTQVGDEIRAFAESKEPLEKFRCKRPADFGEVPDEAAVKQFLAEFQSRHVTEATWNAVMEAARKGNWQARWFVYAHFMDIARNSDDLALQYRVLQLKEWLVSQRLGPVYAEYEEALAATGMGNGIGRKYASPGYLLAAFRGSYTSMAGVGEIMEDNPTSEIQSAGRAMIACAKANLPQFVH